MAKSCSQWKKVRGEGKWIIRTGGTKGVLVHHEYRGWPLTKYWVVREYRDIDHPFEGRRSKVAGNTFKTAKAARQYADRRFCGRKS